MLIKGTRVFPSPTYRRYEVGSRDLGVLAFIRVHEVLSIYICFSCSVFVLSRVATVIIDVNLTSVIKKYCFSWCCLLVSGCCSLMRNMNI